MSRFNFLRGTFISVCDQPPRSTQPGHPFVSSRNEYQPKGGDMPRGWGVKACMVRMWVAGKLSDTLVIYLSALEIELIINAI